MTVGPIPVTRSGLVVTLPQQAFLAGAVTAPNDAAATAIESALTWLGWTYAWGGGDANGPTQGVHDGGVADSYGDYNKIGFDCSGLCLYSYAQAGVQLDRPSAAMLAEAPSTVAFANAQPGDLLFWGNPVHHVAIYIGLVNGSPYMIEAPQSGDVVKVSPVRTGGDFRGVAREPWAGTTSMIVDFTRPIDPAALKANGVTGILRYLAKQHGSTVVVPVTRSEIDGYHAAGIQVGIIYEDTSATWMGGGWVAGQQAGQWVASQLAGLGLPPNTAVYYCADDPGLSAAAVNACLDGAASIRGTAATGLYAFGPQLASAKAGGHAAWFWLCGSQSNEAPGYHLWQHNNNSVTISGVVGDQDDALQANWGQIGNQVDDMAWTDLVIDPSTGQPALDTNGNTFTYGTAAYWVDKEIWALGDAINAVGAAVNKLAATPPAPATVTLTDAQLTALEQAVSAAVAQAAPSATPAQIAAATVSLLASKLGAA